MHKDTSIIMIIIGLAISFFSYLIASNAGAPVGIIGYLFLLSIGIPIIITSLPLFFLNIRKGEILDILYGNLLPLILVTLSITVPFLYIKFDILTSAKGDEYFSWIWFLWGIGNVISIPTSFLFGMIFSWLYRRDA